MTIFWLEVAQRAIRLTREEDFLGDVENEALDCAERALSFVVENYELRQNVARANAQAIAEGADHV